MAELHSTPNMELGRNVVEALISDGLVTDENQETIFMKICGGKMTANEWKSCVKMKILKDESKVNDAKSDRKN